MIEFLDTQGFYLSNNIGDQHYYFESCNNDNRSIMVKIYYSLDADGDIGDFIHIDMDSSVITLYAKDENDAIAINVDMLEELTNNFDETLFHLSLVYDNTDAFKLYRGFNFVEFRNQLLTVSKRQRIDE